MSGRPSSFPIKPIQDAITGHKNEIMNQDGSLVKRSSEIWRKLSEELENIYPITPFSLHVLLSTNRYGLQENLLRNPPNIEESDHLHNSSSTSSSVKSIDSSGSSSFSEPIDTDSSSSTKKINENFKITFSSEEWNRIAPEDVVYRTSISGGKKFERRYTMLRRGAWTNLVHEHVVLHTNLKCCMSYSGGKVAKFKKPYVKVNGKCSFCNTILEGIIPSPPDQNTRVIMSCTLKRDVQICSGRAKRQLKGSLRKTIVDKMTIEKKSPSCVQKELATKMIDSAITPSLEVLRKAKSNANREKRFDSDPVMAVVMAKYVPPYSNFIKDVCYDKLNVHFWSAPQIHAERKYCMENEYSRISIDATGQVVKNVIRPNGERSSHIMLYEIVIHDKQKKSFFPVGSMLSEKQDTETIRHWLNVWMRDGAMIPKEIVTDMSLALTNACIQAFTNMRSLEEYLNKCEIILKKETMDSIPLPACFIV